MKQLKRKIEELLGPQIEEEIEKQAVAGHLDNGEETLVSKITDSIIKSRPYVVFTHLLFSLSFTEFLHFLTFFLMHLLSFV